MKDVTVRIADGSIFVDQPIQLDRDDEIRLVPIPVTDKDRQTILDLYTLEYEQTQEHYRDGYRAVWTNFSYIAVAVGAILGLGARAPAVPLVGLVTVATGLIVFWYVATFRPLDDYGEERATILANIEGEVNRLVHATVWTHWTALNQYRRARPWRVKRVVRLAFWAILVVFAASLLGTLWLLLNYLTWRFSASVVGIIWPFVRFFIWMY